MRESGTELITSKEQLIKELAAYLDMSNPNSWPYVDLTAQVVDQHLDPDYVDVDVEEELDGHELVDVEPKSSHDGYEMMEDFARTRNDYECGRIFRAISGRKPFRAFRVCVETLGILEEWYAYKNDAMLKMAEAVLEDHEIDFVDGKIVCTNPQNIRTFVYEHEDDEEDEDVGEEDANKEEC